MCDRVKEPVDKLQVTKAAIVAALSASAPLTIGELISEVKKQGYMSKFPAALSALQLDVVVYVDDEDVVELF
jgi:hypothetical protein